MPCSQFRTVEALKPNSAANRSWLMPSRFRIDLTSTTGGTRVDSGGPQVSRTAEAALSGA